MSHIFLGKEFSRAVFENQVTEATNEDSVSNLSSHYMMPSRMYTDCGNEMLSLSHARENWFICNLCGKSYKRKDHLKRHLAFHSGERHFSCSVCGKRFLRADTCRVHLVNVHKIHSNTVF